MNLWPQGHRACWHHPCQGPHVDLWPQVVVTRYERRGMSLYRKLADDLREQIVSGDFPHGSELPSEAQLRRQFDVGRDTVRRAYDVLTHEGLIETSQGRGRRVRSHEVFVLDASRHENLQFSEEESGDSYSNEVRHAGRRPHQEFRVELQP